MVVEFNAKKAFSVMDMIPALKSRFEEVILAYAKYVLGEVDDTYLAKIIVTDNFVEDVQAFQREHLGGRTQVTNNDYGRAMGKTIHSEKDDRHYIFLDAEYGSFLIDDEIFATVFEKLDEDVKQPMLAHRSKAINILAHELEHYKFHILFVDPEEDFSLSGQYRKLLLRMYNEYAACRNAMNVSTVAAIPYDEEYMQNIETFIMEQRSKYNHHQVSLDKFCSLFHQYTFQALMNISANIGSKHGIGSDTAIFEHCLCGDIIVKLEQGFAKAYDTAEAGKEIQFPETLIDWVSEYYACFRVYLEDTADGIYYDIPVC